MSLRRVTEVELIEESGVFDAEFYRAQVPELPQGVDLVEHYVSKGAAEGLRPSSMFDTRYYKAMNPEIGRRNPLAHFCEYGWKELRNPSPRFNTWWYWSKHLDPSRDEVNPLAHYESVGKAAGLSVVPARFPSRGLGTGHRFEADRSVRRVCLFAGYDPDGIVDDYVVGFVAELARHADVYYLADCEMAEGELAKLSGSVQGAWAQRHGEYDFGSYARLVERVGWSVIEQYDELLLVNDSSYLLRPLDEVFAQMDARACDWWGLQATKGIHRTRRHPANLFREPIPMDRVRTELVDNFEEIYWYDFHIASYFLAYRAPVIADPEFRRYLGSVTAQEYKLNVILKYEVGLTHWLIQHGHTFDTLVTRLYGYHPAYTQWYFRLLDEGFPLLKRRFLVENPFQVPKLASWAQRVRQRVPDLDVAPILQNLARVADPAQLHRSLHLDSEDGLNAEDYPWSDRLLSASEFAHADRLSQKHGNWWAFPIFAPGTLPGNQRAIFEAVKDDPSIHKIILTSDRDVSLGGVNVEVTELESVRGQNLLMRAGTILVERYGAMNLPYPLSGQLHTLVQLPAGMPFLKTDYAASGAQQAVDRATTEQLWDGAIISSSAIDALATAAACYPSTIHQVWNTGLPRHDFIVRAEDELPEDLRTELTALRSLLGGRRLVLFIPATREVSSSACSQFGPAEAAWLDHWLQANECVLGFRDHGPDVRGPDSGQLAELPTLDLNQPQFGHVEMLYRASSALITDCSSAFVDYLLTGKPAVSFTYDSGACHRQPDSFSDLETVFPGPVCSDFHQLQTALDQLFSDTGQTETAARTLARRLFFDHGDDRNAARVVERLRDVTELHGIGP